MFTYRVKDKIKQEGGTLTHRLFIEYLNREDDLKLYFFAF